MSRQLFPSLDKVGQTPLKKRIVNAYRYFRYRRSPQWREAKDALREARRSVIQSRGRHALCSEHGRGYGANRSADDGLLCIEDPDEAGLRLVGAAHDLVQLSHTGWFTDMEGNPDQILHGVVYQMAARKGCARYVPGIREDDCVLLAFGDVVEGDRGGRLHEADDEEAIGDAARLADRDAELYAERAREYSTAWHAGRCYEEIGEEMQPRRDSIRAEIARIRHTGADSSDLEDMLEELQSMRERRLSLREGDGDPTDKVSYTGFCTSPELRAAFAAAAGLKQAA